MLFQLLTEIQREKIISVAYLARRFQVSIETLEPMLARWVKQGKIHYIQRGGKVSHNAPATACKPTCGSCHTEAPSSPAIQGGWWVSETQQ